VGTNTKYQPRPVEMPVTNINQYVRVPGRKPYPLGRALQEWDGVNATTSLVRDTPAEQEERRVYQIHFATEEGQSAIPVSEQIYEVALYTRATKRFTEWMRANGKGRPSA
jgi:hypothetical protein